jgi:predicted phosphoribosyltransferase
MIEQFVDRIEGGRVLAAKLAEYKNRRDVVVLALPRGGVPVAFEVAKELNAPLDVFVVRKLGVPGHEELAFGAIASGGATVFNQALVQALNLPESLIAKVIERERIELERREELYRANHPQLDINGKIAIIVDDGLATGATMRAAVVAVQTKNPKQIIVAAPVASHETCRQITRKSNVLCFCETTPEPFYAVGMWYRNFDPTTDSEVIELLEKAGNTKTETMAISM